MVKQMWTVRGLQTRSVKWVIDTFKKQKSETRRRGFRFLEEAVELTESVGMSREEAHKIVDYVFDRERPGEPFQEVGGVMVTLAACAHANGIDIEDAWLREQERCDRKSDQIIAKDDAKPDEVKA